MSPSSTSRCCAGAGSATALIPEPHVFSSTPGSLSSSQARLPSITADELVLTHQPKGVTMTREVNQPTQADYERPTIEVLGSFALLTLGSKWHSLSDLSHGIPPHRAAAPAPKDDVAHPA